MKQTKRRIEPLSFFNQNGIQTHLEKMAEQGWMIEKITNTGWVYRKMEPQTVKFAVSYYPKASEFDPEPTEGQKMFHDFCAHTGWELACTSAQMQIFYNEQENPTPIETEPGLELHAIHASAKKSFLPSYFLLLAVCVLQALMFISSLLGDPIELLANPTRLFTGVCFILLFSLCSVEIACYFIWHAKAKKAASHGEFITPPNTALFQKIVLWFTLIGGAYYIVNMLFSGDPVRRWLILLMCVFYPLLFILVNGTKDFLKRKKASKGLNRTVTMMTSFILAFALVGIITYGTISLSNTGFFAKEDEETYEHNGMTWVIHHDELPLTVEDLLDIEFDGYIKEQQGEESLFLGYFKLNQWPRFDAEDYRDIPTLEYKMVVVKMPFLYEICKSRLIEEEEQDYPFIQSYISEDAEPWDANEVYRLSDADYGPRNTYLLCYDHVIVEIRFDWEPTTEQMAIVGEKLGA